MFYGDRHLFHHHRRYGGPVSGGLCLIAALCTGGWNQIQGHRFSSACSAISAGELTGQAELKLERRGGRRVQPMNPVANQTEYRFKSYWGSNRSCTIESLDGLVMKASGS
jgi:hypothetical protein